VVVVGASVVVGVSVVVGASVAGTVVGGTVVGGTVVAEEGVTADWMGAVSDDAGESALDVCEHADSAMSAPEMQIRATPVRIEVMWKSWGEKTVGINPSQWAS